jgi:hypothetical protein
MVTKALVPPSSVSRCGANTFVNKEGSEFAGKGLKMMKVVVHDEDEVAMWVIGSGLPSGGVDKGGVVPFFEMLMRYNAWCTALGHAKCVGGPNV